MHIDEILAEIDRAAVLPLHTGGCVIHLPEHQPMVLMTPAGAAAWIAAAWPELSATDAERAAAKLGALVAEEPRPVRFSIGVHPETALALEAERQRFATASGLRKVSLNNVVNRLLRIGLAAERP